MATKKKSKPLAVPMSDIVVREGRTTWRFAPESARRWQVWRGSTFLKYMPGPAPKSSTSFYRVLVEEGLAKKPPVGRVRKQGAHKAPAKKAPAKKAPRKKATTKSATARRAAQKKTKLARIDASAKKQRATIEARARASKAAALKRISERRAKALRALGLKVARLRKAA